LGAELAEQSELEELLLTHFGRGSHAVDREIWCGRSGGEAAIRLIYDGDGILDRIEPGPDLKDDDVDILRQNIQEQLIQVGVQKVRQRILFSSVPTIGSFTHGDEFQILPVPENAPRPRALLGEHPFMVEHKYNSSSNAMISMRRQERIGRELELIFSSLLSWRVRSISQRTQFNWSVELKE
jgi:hypothetical protein